MGESHKRCPCGLSSDAYSIQDNGWGKCHSCGDRFPPNKAQQQKEDNELPERGETPKGRELSPIATDFRDMRDRDIPKSAAQKFKIDVAGGQAEWAHKYPYFKNGRHVGNKVRRKGEKDENTKVRTSAVLVGRKP
jgi:twinkle protein